jgi:hypothetical protein
VSIFDDAQVAMTEFNSDIDKSEYNYLILTSFSNEYNEREVRNRRETVEEVTLSNSSNSSYTVVGDNCAAMFRSISMINETVLTKNKEAYLEIDESSLKFDCENSTAKYEKFEPTKKK